MTRFAMLLPDCVDLRAAVVEYGDTASVSFDFSTYTPLSTLREALNVFNPTSEDLGQGSNLAVALRTARVDVGFY